ncbi:uncharacterized protein LOC118460529 isoform X2 [Anopheles albimanus]|uniref:uncharacterized protein LOC118460529 isoform X2 n=1 Tax=Anopheles albimanus TaxID=7167 RepID=UPI0016423375|nr:uncharacterized protein LOC118460529 isoform X2 [Anopheles albimanus]
MFTMLPELLSVLQRTNDYVSLEEICKKLPESESYEEMSNLRELLSSASEAVQLGASFYSRLRILNEDIATNGLKNALVKARASEDGSSDSDESEDREELKASSGRKKRTMTPKVSSSANKKSDKSPSTPKRKRK